MFTELRRFGWREQFDAGPIGLHEYVRDVLRVEDLTPLTDMDAWEEVPQPLRDCIIVCCLAEKNTGKPIHAEAVAEIAHHHRVPLNPVLLALGWMPPPSMQLNELERDVLRLAAAVDRANRTAH
jgi:hypothetical protein